MNFLQLIYIYSNRCAACVFNYARGGKQAHPHCCKGNPRADRQTSGIFTYLCARRIDLLGSLRACITISNYSVDRAYAAWKAAWAARRGMALDRKLSRPVEGEGGEIVVASSLRKRRSRWTKCHEASRESVKLSWTFSRNVRMWKRMWIFGDHGFLRF